MQISSEEISLVYVPYGHTGGDQTLEARTRTDEIISQILQDMDMQVKGPKFIIGDLNASVNMLPNLHGAITNGKLYDLGKFNFR